MTDEAEAGPVVEAPAHEDPTVAAAQVWRARRDAETAAREAELARIYAELVERGLAPGPKQAADAAAKKEG